MTILHLTIVPDAGTDEQNLEGAGELAWEHATTLARQVGIDVGGDHFISLFNELSEQYAYCSQHYGFIQHMALRVLHELLHTGRMALLSPPMSTPQEATALMQNLAQVVTSAMMWMYVSADTSWITNEQWDELSPDERGVEFTFELIDEGENDDND